MNPAITDEQRKALQQTTGPVYVTDPKNNAQYVLLPVANSDINLDETALVQAIKNRRDQSRSLNQEWSDVDRELWNKGE